MAELKILAGNSYEDISSIIIIIIVTTVNVLSSAKSWDNVGKGSALKLIEDAPD